MDTEHRDTSPTFAAFAFLNSDDFFGESVGELLPITQGAASVLIAQLMAPEPSTLLISFLEDFMHHILLHMEAGAEFPWTSKFSVYIVSLMLSILRLRLDCIGSRRRTQFAKSIGRSLVAGQFAAVARLGPITDSIQFFFGIWSISLSNRCLPA